MFFGDAGESNFTQKVLHSAQRNSLLYWMYNIIEQNRPFSSFSRMLLYLERSIKFFLYKQWHDALTDDQAADLYKCIVSFFGLEDLVAKVVEENKDAIAPKNPPNIRIRGLFQ